MQQKQQVQQHLSRYDAKDILDICEPLRRHFGLKSLVYKRVYKDGSEINLSTHPDWVAFYFERELYCENVFEKEIENYKKGHLLWSQIPTHSPILAAVGERYGIANGLTLIRPDCPHGFCEFYFLGADSGDASFAQLCANNMDLLDQFVDYFRYQAGELITDLNKCRIRIVDKHAEHKLATDAIPCYQSESMRDQFVTDLTRNGVIILVNDRTIKLSRREAEIARLLVRGMTMKQVADCLFVSPRTVETHIDHIKSKLGIYKKSELVQCLQAVKGLQGLAG